MYGQQSELGHENRGQRYRGIGERENQEPSESRERVFKTAGLYKKEKPREWREALRWRDLV